MSRLGIDRMDYGFACTFMQSDQNLHCSLMILLDIVEYIDTNKEVLKALILLQADLGGQCLHMA